MKAITKETLQDISKLSSEMDIKTSPFEDRLRLNFMSMLFSYKENSDIEKILDTKFTTQYLKKIATKIVNNEIYCSLNIMKVNPKTKKLYKYDYNILKYVFQPYYIFFAYGIDQFKSFRYLMDEDKREELYKRICIVYEYVNKAQHIDHMVIESIKEQKEVNKLKKKYKGIRTFSSFIPLDFENSKRLVNYVKEEQVKRNGKILQR